MWTLGAEMIEEWTTPDFVEYETPMEVTAYAARMED
ncbi:pyrroloquinoline quinone precursor peptide PqqA [Amycolatopsis roodepoortensis]|uniref:Coenzyme PQQ synthesis protein A n=1 Tax=Amycolatopsis roodepoortensis TaxID=700274 RepID=A0ABR9L6X3_9PSEU|nr:MULTISPECIES: pyrroloquinoline quinone precursor peptide PqqA [Amycolatopsis]MBE1575893.1 coenzyme PQQ precursor peptide PqqA [Amycolatopsis roodepoortensis]QXV61890.1 pyrroloquinoline quinone precursor peptide PqqA [Amycolatopsis sp. TNS106]RSN11954.1 pyrroloquinoline quinone precursor peptide PqqA [Streptomyces sp. WAC 05977]UUV29463.1 pyrroloquinoline quinone precursor peptide PqqA [Amycolatopsis roodepoortensis]